VTFLGHGAGARAAAFAAGAGASLEALAAAAAPGAPDAAAALLEWVAARCSLTAGVQAAEQGKGSSGGGGSSSSSSTALAAPAGGGALATGGAPPPLQPPQALPLALPYSSYRLVTATGRPVERPDKHPFGLSRVHYGGAAGGGAGGGVWFEHADGTARWRQSAAEVEVLCLRVPPALPPGRLAAEIGPYSLHVTDRVTGDVYLSGDLARGVVPGASSWVYGGGADEDGCVVTLVKMNLELFERWVNPGVPALGLGAGAPSIARRWKNQLRQALATAA
jgi:hypothetical protein